MKNLTQLGAISIFALLLACNENEVVAPTPTPPVQIPQIEPALVSFRQATDQLHERDGNQKPITIALSKAAPAEGTITIKVESNGQIDKDFRVTPASANGALTLPVAKAATSVEFQIASLQNETVDPNRWITFTIFQTVGGVAVGSQTTLSVQIRDDDFGKQLASYETVAGSWRTSREFSYTESGLVKQITWANFTPGRIEGYYKYEYENGKLARMIDQSGYTTQYQWAANRVIKTEKLFKGQRMQIIEYDYDAAGNVGEMVFYDRQPTGELQLSMVQVFLYYLDGNLYKRLTYYVTVGTDDLTLATTMTFENYLKQPNPQPMVETLPHLNPQPNLPRTYRIETFDKVLTYQINYVLRSDGYPTERTVSDGAVTETTRYTYK
jgi:YD repeat-containing protein